jgi:hypothetical protein
MPAPDSEMSMIRQIDAVGQNKAARRVHRRPPAVAAVFRRGEQVAVGEPGELGGELVALARRRRNRHGEAVLEDPCNVAFEPSQMVDIGNDALAGSAGNGGDQRYAARRHVNDLAGKFAAVGQHIAAEQVHAHALVAAAILVQSLQTWESLR